MHLSGPFSGRRFLKNGWQSSQLSLKCQVGGGENDARPAPLVRAADQKASRIVRRCASWLLGLSAMSALVACEPVISPYVPHLPFGPFALLSPLAPTSVWAASNQIVQVIDLRRPSDAGDDGEAGGQDGGSSRESASGSNRDNSARGAAELDLSDSGSGGRGNDSAGGSALVLGSRLYGEPVPVPRRLLDQLAWTSPWPGQAGCGAIQQKIEERWRGKIKGPMATPDQAVQSLLTEGSEQLLQVELESAQKALKDVRLVLPCVSSLVSRESLRAIHVLQAVALASAGDSHTELAFRQLMAVDPRLYLEPEYPPKVRKQFLAVAQTLLKEAPVPLDLTGLDGELYLNGQQVNRQTEVLAGTHFLQMKGPSGQIRSSFFALEGPSKQKVQVRGLVDIALPSTADMHRLLLQALKAGQLEGPIRQGLDAFLKQSNQQAVAFVVSGQGKKAQVLGYRTDSGLTDVRSIADLLPEGDASLIPPSALSFGLDLHVGTGLTSSMGTLLPNLLVSAGPHVQVGGLRTVLDFQSHLDLSSAGAFPSFSGQLLTGWAIPLAPVVSVMPMVGYQVGTGPAMALTDCAQEAGTTQLSCGAGAGSTTVWMKSFGHGVAARIGLQFDGRRAGTKKPLAATVGIQGFYSLSSSLTPSTVTLEDGSQLTIQVDDSVKPSALRIEGMGGLMMLF